MTISRSRSQARFAILPPVRTEIPPVFRNVACDNRRHTDLLARMQRLRGRVYEADGAIRSGDLTSDGRHKLSVDQRSWHVLSLDENGAVIACLRYLDASHVNGLDSLRVNQAPLARCPEEGPRFRCAMELEMKRARAAGIGFGEVGGWAVAEDHRWTAESLRIVLATYGLLELLGGCAGVATATFRHSSAHILQRIGLSALRWHDVEIPPYQDPQYGCLMQILQFDSRSPHPRYRDWILDLMDNLQNAPIVGRETTSAVLGRVWRGIEAPDYVGLSPVSTGG